MSQMNVNVTSQMGADPHKIAATGIKARARIASIDVMRGLVMVLMLIDHVREKLWLHHPLSDPMDIDTTSPEVFFTRMTAHICAPVFVFLTGLSMWLYSHPASGVPRSAAGFLFKRGLFLLLIEITLVNFSWTGGYSTLWLQVIWAIGLSMIALSALIRLPYWSLAVIGSIIVFGHNLLTPISFVPGESGYMLWTILHDRGYLIADGALRIKISYPVLPWIGVILLGYVAGPIYSHARSSESRVKILYALGGGCLLLFLLLRGFNLYGETLPWEYGATTIQTIMSFVNFTKYPPSLLFLLLTMGAAFLLMARFEFTDNWLTRVFALYGSAPMFFYIFHLYVLLLGYRTLLAIFGPNQGTRFGVDDFWWVWVASAALSFALYLPTRKFARFKRATKMGWVKYF